MNDEFISYFELNSSFLALQVLKGYISFDALVNNLIIPAITLK